MCWKSPEETQRESIIILSPNESLKEPERIAEIARKGPQESQLPKKSQMEIECILEKFSKKFIGRSKYYQKKPRGSPKVWTNPRGGPEKKCTRSSEGRQNNPKESLKQSPRECKITSVRSRGWSRSSEESHKKTAITQSESRRIIEGVLRNIRGSTEVFWREYGRITEGIQNNLRWKESLKKSGRIPVRRNQEIS